MFSPQGLGRVQDSCPVPYAHLATVFHGVHLPEPLIYSILQYVQIFKGVHKIYRGPRIRQALCILSKDIRSEQLCKFTPPCLHWRCTWTTGLGKHICRTLILFEDEGCFYIETVEVGKPRIEVVGGRAWTFQDCFNTMVNLGKSGCPAHVACLPWVFYERAGDFPEFSLFPMTDLTPYVEFTLDFVDPMYFKGCT